MIKLYILILLVVISNLSYASDDYSYLAQEKPNISSNIMLGKQSIDYKAGYISLPHSPNEKDTASCIVDKFIVELDEAQQLHLLFDEKVDSALVQAKDESNPNGQPMIEELIEKGTSIPIEYGTGKKLVAGKYVFEVHSFVNNNPNDRKTHYYLWLKTENADLLRTDNLHNINKSFQRWLKSFMNKVNNSLLLLPSLVIAVLILKELFEKLKSNR